MSDLTTIQRLEETFGAHQVSQWAEEGMPVDAMGTPSKMEQYRQEGTIQRSAKNASPLGAETTAPDAVHEVLESRGRPLPDRIQSDIEERMDASFGDVTVHTGAKAADACDAINARAFSFGNHVAFNRGEYDPSSQEGQHVIAHELAHVRQQTGGAVSMLPQAGELEIDPDERLEREAERTAQRVMDGGELGIQRLADTDVHIQRMGDFPGNFDGIDQPASEEFDIPVELSHPAEKHTGFSEVDEEELKRKIEEMDVDKYEFDFAGEKLYRKVFYAEYPELIESVPEVHHAVEQKVLDEYPGVVSKSEMDSLMNLRGIPSGNTYENDLHRSTIRREWNSFYNKMAPLQEKWIELYKDRFGDVCSDRYPADEELSKEMVDLRQKIRERLLEKAAEIDEDYGDGFLPEIDTSSE